MIVSPHDFLWGKLTELGIHTKCIQIMRSIYSNSSTKIILNGHLTRRVQIEQGIMQGCILSPLLFTLYISGLGHMLEKSPLGCKIHQVIISALLYVDDLILIGSSKENLIKLLQQTQHYLEWLGLNINCGKSNIMSALNIEEVPLYSTKADRIGSLKREEMYKYLGVPINMGRASAMFKDAKSKKQSNLKAIMRKILDLAHNSFCPTTVGLTLWNSCAIPALLHGIEIISLSEDDFKNLESIQSQFAAGLLGVPTGTAHCGLCKELGLTTLKTHIYRRKLLYVQRLASLDDSTWAKQAYLECELAKGKTPNMELSKLHINNARLGGQWLMVKGIK